MADSANCISEKLYHQQADALVSKGFLSAGYNGIHLDGCWEKQCTTKTCTKSLDGRDPATGALLGSPERFPSGMRNLGEYFHNRSIKYALYTSESKNICGCPYAGSESNEQLDADTFAGWGVDYMKVDGCGNTSYYNEGYRKMGLALEGSGRQIEYSCSWPAYINGGNESLQPFALFIEYGCNLWRNWHDIQCNWESLSSIIDHWGHYGRALQPYAGPGHWHDMDMLLIGSISGGEDGGIRGHRCVSLAEERTQMAIWCISASPLIMGNDLRNISEASKSILLNADAIGVSQDPLGQMGIRLTSDTPQQVWSRVLANGDVAVALYNKGTSSGDSQSAADVKLDFALVDLRGLIEVYDIWDRRVVGRFNKSYTAKAVPHHGTAFLRLSSVQLDASGHNGRRPRET